MWDKLEKMHEDFEHEKGNTGMMAGNSFKLDLKTKEKKIEEKYMRDLETLILETSKTSAL
jgi:hypothetical protein